MSTNAERMARLEQLRAESLEGGGAVRVERQHAAGKLTARERLDLLLDDGLLLGARRVRHPPGHGVRRRRAARPRRWRHHGPRDHRRATGLRLQPGLHGLRGLAVGGVRREDLQDHGPGDEGRRADHRPQRFRRSADPGGRRLAGRLRRDLPAQRHGVGRRAADLGDPRAVRRRRGVLAGHHGLHGDGRGDELHVRHRAERRAGRDPRGRRCRVAGRRGRPHRAQRRRASRGPRRGRGDGRRSAACSPTCRRTTSPTRRSIETRDPRDRMDVELDDVVPDEPAKPYDMHDVLRRVVDDGGFLEIQPAWAANILVGFARLGGRAVGIVAQQPAVLRRRARHRCVGEGRALRPDLRRVQRAAGHLRRRAGFPARRRAGARRDHPPRREAALRVLRGDGAQGDGHHAQGVRRRVRRHEQQAHPRRLQLRVAERGDRGDGRRGRGEHHLQGRDRRRRAIRTRNGRASSRPTRRSSRTPTSPPRAATSTRSSCRARRGRDSSAPSRCWPTSRTRTRARSMATSRSDARGPSASLCKDVAPDARDDPDRAAVPSRPRREPRARSPSGSSAPVATWAWRRSPSTAMRTRTPRTSGWPTRPSGSDRRRPARATCASTPSWTPPIATGAEAVHPGYGFLAERAAFARAVEDAGLVYVGPSPATIERSATSSTRDGSRQRVGVPAVPGPSTRAGRSPGPGGGDRRPRPRASATRCWSRRPPAGEGGGCGASTRAGGPAAALAAGSHEAAAAFGDGSVYLEREILPARHVEVQLLADGARHASSRSASGTARCSGGTRSSSRRRPRPG